MQLCFLVAGELGMEISRLLSNCFRSGLTSLSKLTLNFYRINY